MFFPTIGNYSSAASEAPIYPSFQQPSRASQRSAVGKLYALCAIAVVEAAVLPIAGQNADDIVCSDIFFQIRTVIAIDDTASPVDFYDAMNDVITSSAVYHDHILFQRKIGTDKEQMPFAAAEHRFHTAPYDRRSTKPIIRKHFFD